MGVPAGTGTLTVLAALLLSFGAPAALEPTFSVLDVSPWGAPMDAGVDGSGLPCLLYRGFPRLVMPAADPPVELDLPETALPGGLCVLESGQTLVSDRMGDLIRRYDGEGALLEEVAAPGSPGDLAMVGLEYWYFSRDDCRVRQAGDQSRTVLRVSSDCLLRLSGGSREAVACDGRRVWRLVPGESPETLPFNCLDAAMLAGRPLLLVDSTTALLLPADTLRLPSPCSRVAGSPGGWALFWSPSSETVTLLR